MNLPLRSKLKKQYEELVDHPSENLWMLIDEQLSKKSSEPSFSWPKKMLPFAATFLIFIFVSYFVVLHFSRVDRPNAQKTLVLKVKPTETFPLPENISTRKKILLTNPVPKMALEIAKQPSEDSRDFFLESTSNSLTQAEIQANNKTSILESITTSEIDHKMPTKSEVAVKYITAQELLFEREMNKTYDHRTEKTIQSVLLQKPREINLMGFTIYSRADTE